MTETAADEEEFHCPTCGARQAAENAECRRCRCDLRLVLALRQSIRELHETCLKLLAAGRLEEALAHARRRHELSPDDTSRRLVAVALLYLERFDEAVNV